MAIRVPMKYFKRCCLKSKVKCYENGGDLNFGRKTFCPRLIATVTVSGREVDIECLGTRRNIDTLREDINEAGSQDA